MKTQAKFYCTCCGNKVHGFRCSYCGSLKVEARYEEAKGDNENEKRVQKS